MPPPAARNQTLTFLLRRFKEAGIRPRTSLGQNFLIDLNLLNILLETARLGPRDVVLEVGTGTGSLTELMAAKAAAVVTVEIDRNLFFGFRTLRRHRSRDERGEEPRRRGLEQE